MCNAGVQYRNTILVDFRLLRDSLFRGVTFNFQFLSTLVSFGRSKHRFIKKSESDPRVDVLLRFSRMQDG